MVCPVIGWTRYRMDPLSDGPVIGWPVIGWTRYRMDPLSDGPVFEHFTPSSYIVFARVSSRAQRRQHDTSCRLDHFARRPLE